MAANEVTSDTYGKYTPIFYDKVLCEDFEKVDKFNTLQPISSNGYKTITEKQDYHTFEKINHTSLNDNKNHEDAVVKQEPAKSQPKSTQINDAQKSKNTPNKSMLLK